MHPTPLRHHSDVHPPAWTASPWSSAHVCEHTRHQAERSRIPLHRRRADGRLSSKNLCSCICPDTSTLTTEERSIDEVTVRHPSQTLALRPFPARVARLRGRFWIATLSAFAPNLAVFAAHLATSLPLLAAFAILTHAAT